MMTEQTKSKYPSQQPFQMKGTPCKSKVNSWWKKFKK